MVEQAGSGSVQETLDERVVQHGPFEQHAHIELKLRNALAMHGGRLTPTQTIAMGMIMHKIARIFNGGHMHSDSWHDIAGYAILAEKSILDE